MSSSLTEFMWLESVYVETSHWEKALNGTVLCLILMRFSGIDPPLKEAVETRKGTVT